MMVDRKVVIGCAPFGGDSGKGEWLGLYVVK